MKPHSTHKKNVRHGYFAYIFAALFIVAGTLLLLSSLDILSSCILNIVLSWQSLIILWGLLMMIRKHWLFGFIVFFTGFYFIEPLLGLDLGNISKVHVYWAVICIAFGLHLLARLLRPKEKAEVHANVRPPIQRAHHRHHPIIKNWKHIHTTKDGFIYIVNVFSDAVHAVHDTFFTGANISNIFGSTRLDLRKAKLQDAEILIDLHCVFGSVAIFIPSQWEVVLETQAILGDTKDLRLPSSEENTEEKKTVIVRGSVILGGLEIR